MWQKIVLPRADVHRIKLPSDYGEFRKIHEQRVTLPNHLVGAQ